jgi:hypothetical protein
MRPSVVLLAFLAVLTGCTGGAGAAGQPAASPHTTLPAAPRHLAVPISARVVLPSRTMAAGSQISGHVVVENNTGHAIRVSGCGTLFQVALVSKTYQPAVAWLTCVQSFTIPVGEASYAVIVKASYLACSPGRRHRTLRACLPGKGPPGLPPGFYHARLFQAGQLLPVPPAIEVRVTPSRPAP